MTSLINSALFPALPEVGQTAIRPGVGALLPLSVLKQQHLRRVTFFQPGLFVVVSGIKVFHRDDVEDRFNDGKLVAVAEGFSADVTPMPDRGRPCKALHLSLSPEVLEVFARQHPEAVSGRAAVDGFKTVALDPALLDAFGFTLRGIQDLENVSDGEARHRLFALLLGLASRGVVFPELGAPKLAEKVRVLVMGNPAAPWTAASVAATLGMSEATLRRRLQAEGERFQEIVIDVRLHHGLILLQSTRHSITRISEACGYDSASRFSERFRDRFGTLPSQFRGRADLQGSLSG